MKKRKWWLLLVALCLLCVWLVQPLIDKHLRRQSILGTRGLFSWSSKQLTEDGRRELFSLMEQKELDTVYQSFSSDTEFAVVYDFLEEAAQRGIAVWLLTGDPDWGIDETGHAMLEEVERVASWQKELPEKLRFRGILMDCEPYLTELWEESPEQVMDCWCGAMETARTAANQADLLFGVCIPYYLDTLGFPDHLKQVIEEGCDALAIMNYYKKKEAEHIETEMQLAAAAGVPVTVIYELQPPGEHGLKDVNTYYHDGFAAAEASWDALQTQFGSDLLCVAFHEYTALQEMMRNE